MAKQSLVGVVALGTALLGGVMLPTATYAAPTEVTVCATECDYTGLAEAVAGVEAGTTVKLDEGVTIDAAIVIDKSLTIDLNGEDIDVASKYAFDLQAGVTSLVGEGKIVSSYNGSGKAGSPIFYVSPYDDANAPTLNIGENVEMESAGYSVAIYHDAGVKVAATLNVDGKLTSTENAPITIYGNNHYNNIVNIGKTAVITGATGGVYAAGNGTWNIVDGAKITGEGYALGIKSGVWNITGGTLITTGEDTSAEVVPHPSGIYSSGATIQIESYDTYYGNIELNISGGTFTSEQGYVLFEYNEENSDSAVKNLKITGGAFASAKGMKISELLIAKAGEITGISGGEFKPAPAAELIATGYKATEGGNDAGYYQVILDVPTVEDKTETDANEEATNEETLSEVGAGVMTELVENLETAKGGDVLKDDAKTFEFTVAEGLSNADLQAAVAAGGLTLTLETTGDEISEGDSEEKDSILEALPEDAVLTGLYYDTVVVLKSKTGVVLGTVTKLPEALKLVLTDVEAAEEVAEGYERTWGVILLHNGKALPLPAEYDAAKKELTTESSLFSAYVPYYVDTEKTVVPGAPNTGAFGSEAGEETQASVMAMVTFAATFAAIALLGYAVKTSKR